MIDYEADRELILSGARDGGGEDMINEVNDGLSEAVEKARNREEFEGLVPANRKIGGTILGPTITGLEGPTLPLKSVKRHFLESELETADDLIMEYDEYPTRQKLIWLLERLQESVL